MSLLHEKLLCLNHKSKTYTYGSVHKIVNWWVMTYDYKKLNTD